MFLSIVPEREYAAVGFTSNQRRFKDSRSRESRGTTPKSALDHAFQTLAEILFENV